VKSFFENIPVVATDSGMKVTQTTLAGVLLLEPTVFTDSRGFFLESYNKQTMAKLGIVDEFVQDNHSFSRRNVLRGLHYQIRQPQGKLVRVARGAVFDVAVDIRKSSPTFGQWVGTELTEDNYRQMWVPAGFAHGFYVLSDSADFLYKTTDYYIPDLERSLAWNDPQVAVSWPIDKDTQPIVSAKDIKATKLTDAEVFA